MQDTRFERLTILLGAGASFGCGARGPRPNGSFFPPLAKDLFSPMFDNILSIYPRLQRRTDEIRSRLAQGQNIETILRDLYQSAEKHSRYWPFQIPLYLRVLLWGISQDYSTGTTKYDTLVRQVLESEFARVMFLTLNYDLFLDDALEGYASRRFTSLGNNILGNSKPNISGAIAQCGSRPYRKSMRVALLHLHSRYLPRFCRFQNQHTNQEYAHRVGMSAHRCNLYMYMALFCCQRAFCSFRRFSFLRFSLVSCLTTASFGTFKTALRPLLIRSQGVSPGMSGAGILFMFLFYSSAG